MTDKRASLAVLCSGRGSNLQAILDAAKKRLIPARVAVVVSDRKDAKALSRALKAGVPAHFLDPRGFLTRHDYDCALVKLLKPYRVNLVCLAGFMRILSPVFVKAYAGRILNIHPALLPAFPGAHAVSEALSWGVKVTGVTVHFVDEKIDHGPIILQEPVAIHEGESEKHLLGRIHCVEHRLYPEAIKRVVAGKAKVRGRQVGKA